ncbi:MAG TPA: hypothetical protein PKA37_06290 [Planctomycetota bacterium]|jgi:hypothetical protein|nr:hypothetical protein [Planctomycetota bacterium]
MNHERSRFIEVEGNRRATLLRAVAILSAAVAAAWFLFPPDSDAAFSLYDPVWYAKEAIHRPAQFVYSHHLLFHLLVLPAAHGLQALGMEAPGVYAIRLISGLAMGAMALLFLRTGASKGVVALFFLAIFLTRGWFLEGMLGENVLPACAAAVACFLLAHERPLKLLRLGLVLVLALLFRQDNIFILPGVLAVAATGIPSGRRLRSLTTLAAVVGVTTLGLYGLSFAVLKNWGNLDQSFMGWMLHLGETSWNPGQPEVAPGSTTFDLGALLWSGRIEDFRAHGSALAYAITGRQFAPFHHTAHLGIAFLWCFLLLLAGFLVSGQKPMKRLWFAIGSVIVLRIPFFARFEPSNPEWWLLPMTLLTMGILCGAAGVPRFDLSVRRAGALLVTVVTLFVVFAHGRETISLRSRLLAEAALQASHAKSSEVRAYGYQNRGVLALAQHGLKPQPLPADFTQATEYLAARLAKEPWPTIVLLDRSIQDGMPATVRDLRNLADAGARPNWPGMKILHQSSSVYVIGLLFE